MPWDPAPNPNGKNISLIRDLYRFSFNGISPALGLIIFLLIAAIGWLAVFNPLWAIGIGIFAAAGVSALVGSFRLRELLLLCIFLSPLIPTAFGYPLLGTEGIVVTPTRLVDILFLASFAVAVIRRPLLRQHFPLSRVFFFYVGVRALGLFFAPDKAGALIQVFGEAGLFTVGLTYLAFCLIHSQRQLDQLVTTLLVTGVLISLAGWWEWTTQRDFNANVMLPLVGITSEIPQGIAMKAELGPRITGTLDHPLALAGFMVLLFPLALQRAILRRSMVRLINWIIVALIGLSLFLSFSRIAQFAAVLEMFALLYFYRRKCASWILSALVVMGTIALIPIYLSVTESGSSNSTLLVPTYALGIISQRWADLGEAFRSNPLAFLIGFGYSRFDSTASVSGGQVALLYSRMDTDILKILAVTGILGFITWSAIFYVFFKRLFVMARVYARTVIESPVLPIGIGVAGALLTALPGQSILTYTQTWPIVGVCMGAALGFLDQVRQSQGVLAQTPQLKTKGRA